MMTLYLISQPMMTSMRPWYHYATIIDIYSQAEPFITYWLYFHFSCHLRLLFSRHYAMILLTFISLFHIYLFIYLLLFHISFMRQMRHWLYRLLRHFSITYFIYWLIFIITISHYCRYMPLYFHYLAFHCHYLTWLLLTAIWWFSLADSCHYAFIYWWHHYMIRWYFDD